MLYEYLDNVINRSYTKNAYRHFAVVDRSALSRLGRPLHILLLRRAIRRTLYSYEERLNYFKIFTLKKRRECGSLMFLHKLLNGGIDSPALLEALNFNVPSRRLRQHVTFHIPIRQTNQSFHNPISRACRLYNTITDNIDFFNLGPRTIKFFLESELLRDTN